MQLVDRVGEWILLSVVALDGRSAANAKHVPECHSSEAKLHRLAEPTGLRCLPSATVLSRRATLEA